MLIVGIIIAVLVMLGWLRLRRGSTWTDLRDMEDAVNRASD